MKLFKTARLSLALAGLLAASAYAGTINGSISFAGGADLLDSFYSPSDVANAAYVQFSNPALVTAASGDYAAAGITFPSFATFTDFAFDPFVAPTPFLWNVWGTSGASMVATSLSTIVRDYSGTLPVLTLTGMGIANLAGFDATLGAWSIAVTESGTTFGFASSNLASGRQVPDNGVTLILVGASLLGLGVMRRKNA